MSAIPCIYLSNLFQDLPRCTDLTSLKLSNICHISKNGAYLLEALLWKRMAEFRLMREEKQRGKYNHCSHSSGLDDIKQFGFRYNGLGGWVEGDGGGGGSGYPKSVKKHVWVFYWFRRGRLTIWTRKKPSETTVWVTLINGVTLTTPRLSVTHTLLGHDSVQLCSVQFCCVGLNKILFIHRNHKLNK